VDELPHWGGVTQYMFKFAKLKFSSRGGLDVQKTTLLVLVLILFTNPTFAGLIGSAHDFGGCGICHSVHNAAGGGGAIFVEEPVYATDFYNSSTLDADITLAGVNASDAPFCLTCHDGASVTDGEMKTTIYQTSLDLTTDLSNDHPTGFTYSVAALADPEIRAAGNLPNPDMVRFGPTRDQMWCSSCHDAHGGVANTPMLVINNEGSALCLACHIK
jgi:predicted CXXCH cytochrome family protein